jgi:hypothetical protein
MLINGKRFVSRFRISVVLLLTCAAVLFLLLAFRPHSTSAQSPTKLWSIDLASDKDFHKRLGIEEVLLDPPTIDFLNDAHLICGFYSGAKIGTGEESVSTGYHILEISALHGSLEQKMEFNAFENGYRALPASDGGFAVFADDKLQKFSDHFESGPVYPTPRVQTGEYFDRWRVDVSPTGQTILLYAHQAGDDAAKWTWLRATDLSVIKAIQGPRTAAMKASDIAGIFTGIDDESLLADRKTTVLCSRCRAHFLTDDLLFLDKGNSYSIEAVTGKELGTGGLDVQALNLSHAAHATRFAYVTGHYVGGGSPLQTHFESITGKIMVLDWSSNKPISEIDVNEPAGNPSAGFTQMALALSPDGKYLAVLLHHTLSLYRLP